MQEWWDAMKKAGRPVARGELADAVTDATAEDDDYADWAWDGSCPFCGGQGHTCPG